MAVEHPLIPSRIASLIALFPIFFSSFPALGSFTDVTVEAGIQHPIYTPPSPLDCAFVLCDTDAIVGGAAVGDVNADGWPDLYVAGSTQPEHLYINQHNGTFVDEGIARGLAQDLYSSGGAFADIDGDSDLDLVILTLNEARLYMYINDGMGNFSEEGGPRGIALGDIPLPTTSYSVAFGDIDRDGWIDMLVGEWSVWAHPTCDQTRTRLLHNLGAPSPGYFEDVTFQAGLATGEPIVGKSYVFGPSFTDLDGDGWQDLVMAGDFGTSQLYWNDETGAFIDGTAAAGIDPEGAVYGMGSTLGDVDKDGDLDWFITGIYDDRVAPNDRDGNRLYLNNGDRTFTDATDLWGVRDGQWGWGAAFWDCDNDADLDLIMTNGMLDVNGLYAYHAATPFRSWINMGTRMSDATVQHGLTDPRAGKGLLTFDYDRDGDLDVFVVNTSAQPALYRNDLDNGSHWLRVVLRGSGANTEALGAKVTLQSPGRAPQIREAGTASHYMGQSERVLHFGLGSDEAPVDLVVRFLSGALTVRANLAVDQTIEILEPAISAPWATATYDNDIDCNNDLIADICSMDASNDCDGNRVLDSCEIAQPGADCDSDGRLDACQPDCDGDGSADACAILEGAADCDSNGVPDDCQVARGGQDCNRNGSPDVCDIDTGVAQDCDLNGFPDSCDLIRNPERDCDGNGTLDLCEGSSDSDQDGVPDCADGCPSDRGKTMPGLCGCGHPEDDTDADGAPDCQDDCPLNQRLQEPGECGCEICFVPPSRTPPDLPKSTDSSEGCTALPGPWTLLLWILPLSLCLRRQG